MKQRLMALTIDFEKAFNTVALITVYSDIRGLTQVQQAAYVRRYVGIIQRIAMKHVLEITDMEQLAKTIHAMENFFGDICEDGDNPYCPWAENTSTSIDPIPDYSSGPHGLHCDCNDCYMKNEPNFKGENYGTLYSTGK